MARDSFPFNPTSPQRLVNSFPSMMPTIRLEIRPVSTLFHSVAAILRQARHHTLEVHRLQPRGNSGDGTWSLHAGSTASPLTSPERVLVSAPQR
ncbi:hypothetical protein FRC03_000401 [Tulasnella sp. 419]|nr:hypothetical protein FRC03_000401 [Tulasnella sp. 419]